MPNRLCSQKHKPSSRGLKIDRSRELTTSSVTDAKKLNPIKHTNDPSTAKPLRAANSTMAPEACCPLLCFAEFSLFCNLFGYVVEEVIAIFSLVLVFFFFLFLSLFAEFSVSNFLIYSLCCSCKITNE